MPADIIMEFLGSMTFWRTTSCLVMLVHEVGYEEELKMELERQASQNMSCWVLWTLFYR